MIKSEKFKTDFEFIDPCSCNAWVAAAVVGSSVIGAGASIFGSSKAADAQSEAAKQAAATQMAMYQQTRKDLEPFRAGGLEAGAKLLGRLDELTAPISVDPNAMKNSDYYK